jgi:ABC-type antimicrobial peptide transport system permease subunit
VYGLMAYSVARRTREIGIRVALGAGKPEVLRNVMTRAGYLLGSGLFLGIAAASAAGPLYSAILYGTNPRDPLTVAAASSLILLIGLGACILPARRALGIAPAMALRED